MAAVARVPPAMLQLIVAPEWEVLGGGGIDVPGLENDESWADRVEMKIVLGFFLMNMLKVLRHLYRAANMITAPLERNINILTCHYPSSRSDCRCISACSHHQ